MAVNVQAAVEAQVLGANLTGMVAKTTKKVDEKDQTTTEFLIMPSALDENEPIMVKDVVNEINRTIYKIENNTSDIKDEDIPKKVKEENIRSAMAVVGLENVELTFMQTFIHYKKVVEKAEEKAGENAEETVVSKIVEYAIGIHIKKKEQELEDNESKQKIHSADFNFLEIKEVYINVWDTSNQKVLERMQIWTPEQLEQK